MPGRYVRDKILTSERVDQLGFAEEVFYRRLMSVVDDYGRFDGRPAVLRAACYPLRLDKVREADITRWIAACEKAGLVVLYEVASKSYVWLLDLGEPRAQHSRYPAPPTDSRTCAQACADAPYNGKRLTVTSNEGGFFGSGGGKAVSGARKFGERIRAVK